MMEAKISAGIDVVPGDDFTRAVKASDVNGLPAWQGEYRIRADREWRAVVNNDRRVIKYQTPLYAIAAAGHTRGVALGAQFS